MTARPLITIVLPTFNEAGNIVELIRALRARLEEGGVTAEVLVIDDNSPDGTAAQVAEAFGPAVRLFVRTAERGLASALRFGVDHASGKFILLMDSDFNHKPEDVLRLLARTAEADLVVGSRYIKGGGMPHARLRHKLSLAFNLLIRGALRLPVKDSLSGFVCIRRSLLKQLPLADIFTGYGDFCIRLLYIAERSGLRISEVPVKYGTRLSGESKTRFFYHALQYLRVVYELRRTEVRPLPTAVLARVPAPAVKASANSE